MVFEVTSDTLIPRPETELLIEVALACLPAKEEIRVEDLGTGCGAIALTLAALRPCWQVYATDISEAALTVAKANAMRFNLSNVHFYQGDWYQAFPANLRFHAILSNPPYLSARDSHLNQGDLRFEPRLALVAGENGLLAFHSIIQEAAAHLVMGGWLMLEHGYNQQQAIVKLLEQSNFIGIQSYKDLAGIERMIVCQSYDKM